MNIIKFPELGLSFNVSRVAFNILGIPIYKYAVCIVVGILVGLIICKINAEKNNVDFEDILGKFILTFIFGIIGARLYYVIFKFDYFKDNILQIFNLRSGGLAIYGGLLLGFVVLLCSFKNNKEKLLPFLDIIVPGVAVAQCIGRWGNFFNIEAYGYETDSFLRMGIIENERYIEVHPVFLYESICTLIIFIILQLMLYNKKFNGQIFLEYIMLYSFVRFFLERFRSDSLLFYGLRISRILSFVLFFISCFFIIKKSRIKSHEKNVKY